MRKIRGFTARPTSTRSAPPFANGEDEPGSRRRERVLIAGHGRVAAARKLRLSSVPVIVARGWSEEEKQVYRLADNELAAQGTWDPDLLRSELRDLKFNGFDLDLIGFEPDRLEDILGGLGSGV
jgi:ParB-like chromosome segregation protein Spo0J